MTIHLPEELESSIEAAVHSGDFATADDAMAEAARLLIRDLNNAPCFLLTSKLAPACAPSEPHTTTLTCSIRSPRTSGKTAASPGRDGGRSGPSERCRSGRDSREPALHDPVVPASHDATSGRGLSTGPGPEFRIRTGRGLPESLDRSRAH